MKVAVSDDFIKELGLFTIRFSNMERMISIAIHDILGNLQNPRAGQIITSALSARNKIDVLDALNQEFNSDSGSQKEMNDIISSLRSFNKIRNKYMHSYYGAGKEGKTTISNYKLKEKSGLKITSEKETSKKLHDYADEIAGYTYKLLLFFGQKKFKFSR